MALPVPGVALLDVLPATIDLAGSEVHLLTRTGREHVLERALEPVLGQYDLILIDCPPSLGVLTINGLTAANAVLIPLQCEALSHRGVGQLLETIEDVRAFANSDLSVRGIIATMYDDRTRHARHIIEEVEARYGIPVLQPPVRKSIRFAEAPARGKSILQHAPRVARGRRLPPAGPHPARHERGRRHRLASGRRTRPAGQTGALLAAGGRAGGRRGRLPGPPGARPRAPTPSSWARTAATPGRPASTPCSRRPPRPARRKTAGSATDPLPPRGVFTVACSSCGAVTRVGVLDFLRLQFPSAPGFLGGCSTGG